MEILRSVIGGSETVSQVSSAETIERLVDRVNTSTLIDDRRDACRALRAMSKKFRLEVGAQGLSSLANVLRVDSSDTEIVSYVLDTICNVCSPEEFDEEVISENRDDITGVGEGFSEIFLKSKDNLSTVLKYLEEFDFKIRRPAVQLISCLLTNCNREVQQQLLDSHVGVSLMMDVLSDTREVLRNDSLILLYKVTKGNANLQKIVAFENAFDRLFEIIEAEGWTDGGIVVEDCLRLCLNLLRNNPSNQTFFKEGGYINRLKLAFDVFEVEDQGWDAQKVANMLHVLHLVRTLVSPANPGQITSACQQSISTSGVLSLLTTILLASGIPADVLTETINTLSEVIRGCNNNQQQFLAVAAPSVPPRPALILLLMSMVNDKQPFSLRCAVLYCFQSYLFKNEVGQQSIVSSLLPASEVQPVDISAGQLLCGGLFSPDPVSNWLCSAALSHVFLGSDKLRGDLLRVQLSTTAGTEPVPLVCQCVRLLQHTPTTNIATKCGLLQLLCSWVNFCPQASTVLLQSKDALSFLLNQIGSNEHDERERLCHGLSAVLLGLCILYNENTTPGHTATDITQLVQKRIGKDMFLGKIGDIPKHESYIRALKTPQLKCASTSDLLFDHMFCDLFRHVERDIINILSNRPVTPVTNGGVGESGDIAQYKNFIREQDEKLLQFVEANNQLHVELTNVRAQYEELGNQVMILKDQNAILQAQSAKDNQASPGDNVMNSNTNAAATINHGDAMRLEEMEKQLRHKDEYISELEARLVNDDATAVDQEKLLAIVSLNQSQAIEVGNLKKQLESLREIIMGKDEQIMELKNTLPIKSKTTTDRFENMFMTSLEVEAHKKKYDGADLAKKLIEFESIIKDQENEIKVLIQERNHVEKELLDSKHKVDDLEQISSEQRNVSVLEEQLRDAKSQIEELLENRQPKHEEIELEKKLASTEEALKNLSGEQEDLLVMLSEQEESIKNLKSRLRKHGEEVDSDEENEDDVL